MRRTLLGIVLALAVALIVVHLAQRQLSVLWPALGVHPEIAEALRTAMDDQKKLARLDPANEALYRRQFETTQALHNRLEILRSAQKEIARSQERILFAVVAITLTAIALTWLYRRRREVRRLSNIETHLERLSAGETRISVEESGTDAIATIGRMIERTSQVMGVQRQRLRSLENLSNWQEAARRHAHEIRTPLTAAQLEIDRLASEIERRHPEYRSFLLERRKNISEELSRLRDFTRNFTSFASVGRARTIRFDIAARVREFGATYANAWPLTLEINADTRCDVEADPALVRQVLVILCSNSALAIEGNGRIAIEVTQHQNYGAIEVCDNGSGVDPSIRSRLFQPYTTTRRVGEGMGLGLAIAKKIMLDQNGDLELVDTSAKGTCFRLTLPLAEDRCN